MMASEFYRTFPQLCERVLDALGLTSQFDLQLVKLVHDAALVRQHDAVKADAEFRRARRR